MTDVYTQENASKKKFLAPVLVILLCMVSLTAAGYAYSATVDNTDDPIDVKGVTMSISGLNAHSLIFEVDDIDVYTHTTNGKAIYYKGNIDSIVSPGFNVAGDSVSAYTDSFDGFGDGYYVEVVKGGNNVCFNEAVDPVAADFLKTDIVLAESGIYKIGETCTLSVVNQSTGAIKIEGKISTDDTLMKGIADVYLVVKNAAGDAVLGFDKLDGEYATVVASQAVASAGVNYKVEVYIALTDFLAPTVPTLPGVGEDEAYHFDVSLRSAAVA